MTMRTFTIFFYYKNNSKKAGVLKSEHNKKTEYDVRPVDPDVVRKFGHQIRIFRIHTNYKIHNHIAVGDREFFTSLIDAIHQYEKAKCDYGLKLPSRYNNPIRRPQKGGEPGYRPGTFKNKGEEEEE